MYTQRLETLEDFLRFLDFAENQIEFSHRKTSEIIMKFDFKSDFFKKSLSSGHFVMYENSDFKILSKSDLNYISSFFSSFGLTDIKGQLQLCEMSRNLIEKSAEDARSEISNKGNLIKKLSLLGGFALAIIIV